jgi:ribosomal protein L34E
MADNRVTLRRRNAYNTRSNRIRMFVIFRISVFLFLLVVSSLLRCAILSSLVLAVPFICSHSLSVKTPGARYVAHYLKKRGTAPRCPETGAILGGLKCFTSQELHRVTKREKSVTRIYGGVLSHGAVKDRILRAFLLEEAKIVAAMQKQAVAAQSKAKKAATKKTGKKL